MSAPASLRLASRYTNSPCPSDAHSESTAYTLRPGYFSIISPATFAPTEKVALSAEEKPM
ncbi:MAG: hypothetical protein BWY81_00406 [Firmicutes bacterium ADurb.Bin467]|nr:MAG: hypothetical protein BWY81_00406 [Firmicutes bacterium ADurb.Bin467]